MWWAVLLLSFAGAFWDEKPVAEWTDIQLSQFLGDSPWARPATTIGKVTGPLLPAFIASATPVQRALEERDRRVGLRRKQEENPLADEYRAWLEDMRASSVVLAIRVGNPPAFSDAAEIRRMEEGCWMRVEKSKVKTTAYFPPTSRDPYLRLAFPRSIVSPGEKTLTFELYLPGVTGPYRAVQFNVKDLTIDGKPEL